MSDSEMVRGVEMQVRQGGQYLCDERGQLVVHNCTQPADVEQLAEAMLPEKSILEESKSSDPGPVQIPEKSASGAVLNSQTEPAEEE